MGFPRQEYRSGLPFSTPGDVPDPGIKLESPTRPTLAGTPFTTASSGKPQGWYKGVNHDSRFPGQAKGMAAEKGTWSHKRPQAAQF